ncbi:MAG: LytTR family DNA-binding domain-containing protein [Oscillospiraceae bacterium]|nr:LytTR family DNA-binding domain-containing protein [Oscillospiraceae bacterium]
MPITIAVCDDSEECAAELRRLLGEWSADKPFALDIDEYASAENFLFNYPDKPCSLLLLDIEMKSISGMELARRLRAGGDMLPIVFVTGYPEHMADGYEVEALHYLLKPVNREKLFAVLDRYVKKRVPENEIMLECEEGTLHVSPDTIIYCEAMGKKTVVRLSDGKTLDCAAGISTLAELLPDCFAACHRSYIVNLRFVRSIGKTELTLDGGGIIPISRRLYKEINEKFIAYYTR